MSRFKTPWETGLRVWEVKEEARLRPGLNYAKRKFTARPWGSAVGTSKPYQSSRTTSPVGPLREMSSWGAEEGAAKSEGPEGP